MKDAGFEHDVRQYLIRCAEPAIKKLAPLPEFHNALAWLKLYDEEPTKQNREYLKVALRGLESGRKSDARAYGYTAVGECYHGLCHIIRIALYSPDNISNSCTQHFEEACWCAARDIEPRVRPIEYWPDKALHYASDRQWKIWNEVFHPEEVEPSSLPGSVSAA